MYAWEDKSCICGYPIGFNSYKLTKDSFYLTFGILSSKTINIHLMDIKDIEVQCSLFDKIFGVGNVILYTKDTNVSKIVLTKVRCPNEIMLMIDKHCIKYKKYLMNKQRMINIDNDNLLNM